MICLQVVIEPPIWESLTEPLMSKQLWEIPPARGYFVMVDQSVYVVGDHLDLSEWFPGVGGMVLFTKVSEVPVWLASFLTGTSMRFLKLKGIRYVTWIEWVAEGDLYFLPDEDPPELPCEVPIGFSDQIHAELAARRRKLTR